MTLRESGSRWYNRSMGCCTPRKGPPLRPDEDPSPEDIARFGSDTVPCRGCGADIYDEADWCHKCGRAQRADGDPDTEAARGVPVWVMITAGVVCVAFLVFSLGIV
jgi:hypothetical protein